MLPYRATAEMITSTCMDLAHPESKMYNMTLFYERVNFCCLNFLSPLDFILYFSCDLIELILVFNFLIV